MTSWAIALLSLGFIAGLFLVATWGEGENGKRFLEKRGGIVYSLSLAVYCTSWTYYGAVGTAVTQGWDYIPIYLGPILVYVFAQPLLSKMLYVANRHNVTSIADFVSARYGKRRSIALLVSLLCLFVVVPYIALQLKAVTSSYQVIIGANPDGSETPWYGDGALPSAVAMAFFAILFGTRKVQLTEQNRGILIAVAFESLVKLIILIILAVIVYFFVLDRETSVFSDFVAHSTALANPDNSPRESISLITKTVLAMFAIFLLPRQFHMAFVSNVSGDYLKNARVWFSGYLGIVTLVVIPIAVAGMSMFPNDLRSADNFVLLIPAASGWDLVSFMVFIGGFSAATSMIIIALLALSIMLSNDVIMPLILNGKRNKSENTRYSELLLPVRRATIVLVMALSWVYYVVFAREYDLAETGLLTFALIIQLAPACIGGLYWKNGNAWGVYAGLVSGSMIWFFTLMLPQLTSIGVIDTDIMSNGLLGFSWLNPHSLFGTQLDSLSHGVFFSLGVNTLLYVLISRLTTVPLQDRIQAAAFVNPLSTNQYQPHSAKHSRIRGYDLLTLLERFIGADRTRESLKDLYPLLSNSFHGIAKVAELSDPPEPTLIKHVERELAGVIGASSASTMVKAVLEGGFLDVEDVVMLFDDTSQAIQFSRRILFSTLEHLGQGVSVVDKDLNLVAWNQSYLEMFDFPQGFIRVGRPISEIIRFNAERGFFGEHELEEHISKRIDHLKRGTPYVYQRLHPNGRYMEIRGNPITEGGFVTSYTDVTEYNNTVKALAESKNHLEERVQERTRTISEINEELVAEVERRNKTEKQLIKAKAEAESANASKTRFLALASHDILQPLNAARLFTATLTSYSHDHTDPRHQILNQLENSLTATEELISILLEIARLDDGKIKPTLQPVNLNDALNPLYNEFGLLASNRGLSLKVRGKAEIWIHTDPTYFRRILQNIISNAVKYTVTGKVLVTYRPRQEFVLIQVWDTGPGISESERSKIFKDFYRIDSTASGQPGIGLGLAIVDRMARLLGLNLEVRSRPNHGSVFSLRVPRAHKPTIIDKNSGRIPVQKLAQLRIICVDDDRTNLIALETLLRRWGIEQVLCILDADELTNYANSHSGPDVLIIDYQLAKNQNGISVYQSILKVWPNVSGILVSAVPRADLPLAAKQAGMTYLAKPIKPSALRSSLWHSTHRE